MIRFIKRVLKYVALGVGVLLILNAIPAFFYKPEINRNPLPSCYKKGVYHMHSTFSDGTGTVDQIARAAASLNYDFTILTDHGRPNVDAATSTAWKAVESGTGKKKDVLVIGGTELSSIAGHLAAMGFETPNYLFPVEPQEEINDIRHLNGVCFLAHPFDNRTPWTNWRVNGFTGLEVYSSYNEARRAVFLNLLTFPLRYLVDSKYALLKTMHYPSDSLAKWDLLDKTGSYYGIYALDTHGELKMGKSISLHFPTYRSMFEIMTVYVKTDGPLNRDAHHASAEVMASLKQGKFFNAVEAIAPANGFDVCLLDEAGKRIEMGGFCQSKRGKLVIELPFDFKTDVWIIKDGSIVGRFHSNREKRLEYEVKEAGNYRVEVHVPGNPFHELPWITSNPFFVGRDQRTHSPDPVSGSLKGETWTPFIVEPENFRLEKNPQSAGEIFFAKSAGTEQGMGMKFKLLKSNDENDFWCSLALRQKLDLSKYKGIGFEARSDKRQWFRVELRTDESDPEKWYSYSFWADKEWRYVFIPFERFHVNNKEKCGIDPSRIASVFVSITNETAYPGTEGVLFLRN
ncbi:MAG: CIA30 family protein [Candidatus Omnitrophota bacterium]